MGLALFALSAGLWGAGAGLIQPLTPFEAATLVATSMLISLCAGQLIAVPLSFGSAADPVAGAARTAPPVLIWSCDPDTPGRRRPRAPDPSLAARAA
jgi:hypothetical protein